MQHGIDHIGRVREKFGGCWLVNSERDHFKRAAHSECARNFSARHDADFAVGIGTTHEDEDAREGC